MKELQDIVQAFEAAQRAGQPTALATVVQVEGSSYRRPGARMLVTEAGQLTGAISGGCLEGDALRKARQVMAQQKSRLVTYDTSDEDDAQLGVGLGCNGIIHILIEPIQPEDLDNPLAMIKQVLAKRQNAVLVTVFSVADRTAQQPGTSILLADEATISRETALPELPPQLLPDAQAVRQNGASAIKKYTLGNGEYTAFLEFVPPAISLVIAGAGNDALPLVTMARLLGWQVTVVDGRANYATTARFPAAHHVLVARPEHVLAQVPVDARTVFVLLTHNYNYDLALLRQLLPLPLPYIGLLGPRQKRDRLLAELATPEAIPEEQLARVYGPMGLDIGAETAEEIALATLAEIKAVFQHKTGTFLRDRPAAIHPRLPVPTSTHLNVESYSGPGA